LNNCRFACEKISQKLIDQLESELMSIKIYPQFMNIHEYQAKTLLASFGVPTSRGAVIMSKDEISTIIDNFDAKLVTDIFDRELHVNEVQESINLGKERDTTDKEKPHMSGRRYFNGINFDGTKYLDHQKKVPK
jgi:hypothetical protein